MPKPSSRRAAALASVFTAALAGASAAVPATARAQDVRDTVRLPEIMVTATHVPVAPNAITSTVTVLAGDELRARGVRFVADALKEVPGAAVVAGGSYGAVSSLFLRGGESDYVKVLVDGVPVNQPGGAFDWADLTLDNVDRIEVVRGPASVIYGSDAITGVVQIFTRRGRGRLALEGHAEGGTFGSVDGGASVAGGTSAVSYSAAASRYASDGTYAYNSDYRNTVLSGALRAFAGATELSLSTRYTDGTYHFPTDGSGVPSDTNQFTATTAVTLAAEAARPIGDRLELRLGASAFQSDSRADDRPDSPADTLGFAFASTRDARDRRGRLDLRLNAVPTAYLTLTAGTQLERETERTAGESTSNFGDGATTTPDTPFDRGRTTAGGYVQAVLDLPQGLAVNLNGRLDDNSGFGTFATYRLGAAYRLRTGTRLRGSIGRAFKAPTFCEQFCDSPFVVGDAALRPERTTSWEAGLEQKLAGARITLYGTWFDQRFRDMVYYDAAAAPGTANYHNGAAARARGIEAGLTAVVTRLLTASASYTWLESEATDDAGRPSASFTVGERLLRRPTHAGEVTLRYQPVDRVSVGGSLAWVGSRDDVVFDPVTFEAKRATLAAYRTVDVSTSVDLFRATPGRPGLTLTARVENLFDAAYEPIAGFPGRGRAVFAGGRVQY
ncbi:MAG TPA: TonB-dependent receptor [Gemmatimonadales bacterium]|nr:TonB-dependent receptor [Gemmatimonadales bacterium]